MRRIALVVALSLAAAMAAAAPVAAQSGPDAVAHDHGGEAHSHDAAARAAAEWVGTYVSSGDKYRAATSETKRVRVRAVVSAKLSRTSILLGRAVTISGAVRPAHAAQPVLLQQRVGTRWRTIARQPQSTAGAVTFTGVKPLARGSFLYRLKSNTDTDHLAGTSAVLTLKVG